MPSSAVTRSMRLTLYDSHGKKNSIG